MTCPAFTRRVSATVAPSATPNFGPGRLSAEARPTLAGVPGLRRFSDSLKDPSAAAERGRWLARGAWLLAAAEVVVAVRNHVTDRLTQRERQRMLEIVRSSKGRPSNLSDRERKELRTLLGKVEPGELAKKVATSPFAGRVRKR